MEALLEKNVLDNPVRDWLFALCFMAGGFVAGKVCSFLISLLLKHVCKRTAFELDDIILLKLKHPLTLLITIAGIGLGFNTLTLPDEAQRVIAHALSSLIIVAFAWGGGGVLDAVLLKYMPARRSDSGKETDVRPLLRKGCGVLIWLIAFVLILRNMGYDVSALLAGLGLGGAALALASKDTLANCFGSITVFVDRPFRINDRIKIMGYDGFITEMGLRTSRIRTLENRTVIIPNSVFSANPIENVSVDPNMVNQTLALKTANGQEKIRAAMALLVEIGGASEGTTGTPSVALVSVNGTVCQITFTFFVAGGADYIATLNRVNVGILSRFEEAGIALA
jgi:MscS family membrane protein